MLEVCLPSGSFDSSICLIMASCCLSDMGVYGELVLGEREAPTLDGVENSAMICEFIVDCTG